MSSVWTLWLHLVDILSILTVYRAIVYKYSTRNNINWNKWMGKQQLRMRITIAIPIVFVTSSSSSLITCQCAIKSFILVAIYFSPFLFLSSHPNRITLWSQFKFPCLTVCPFFYWLFLTCTVMMMMMYI